MHAGRSTTVGQTDAVQRACQGSGAAARSAFQALESSSSSTGQAGDGRTDSRHRWRTSPATHAADGIGRHPGQVGSLPIRRRVRDGGGRWDAECETARHLGRLAEALELNGLAVDDQVGQFPRDLAVLLLLFADNMLKVTGGLVRGRRGTKLATGMLRQLQGGRDGEGAGPGRSAPASTLTQLVLLDGQILLAQIV